MINSYYKSEPDRFWEQLREDKAHAEFFDECREYLLEEYGCNLTQFVEVCTPPCDTIEFWKELAESDVDPREAIDDIAQDEQGSKQQRFIGDIVIGSGLHHHQ